MAARKFGDKKRWDEGGKEAREEINNKQRLVLIYCKRKQLGILVFVCFDFIRYIHIWRNLNTSG